MAVLLHPTPRRLHRTHENYGLDRPTALVLPVDAPPADEQAIRPMLEELLPALDSAADEEERRGVIRFAWLDPDAEALVEAPEAVRREAISLEVTPDEIKIGAGSTAGWLRATRMLRGLREKDELVGLSLLDWPAFAERQIDLPWEAASLSEPALLRWLDWMALCRLNRLGLPGGESIPAAARAEADRWSIAVVEPASDTSARLVARATLYPPYSEALPGLTEAARQAEEDGAERFTVAVGALDPLTSLEALAYGLLFAGDCAWNPRKADLKAHRRWYSLRRFGFDSRALVRSLDALDAGARELAVPAASAADPPRAADSTVPLETGDPLDATLLEGALQPEELAGRLEQHAAAAMEDLAPLQPDTEERAAALQGLQWSAQRVRMVGRRIAVAEQVRQLYRAAFVAMSSPRAVSQRLLRAVDLLEQGATALDEHRVEWHALWRRERQGSHDDTVEQALRAQVETLRRRANRLRDLRSRYIQTGNLPSPPAEGLERTGAGLAEGIVPARLPPQPSPAWWPEGGAARVRIEVECSQEAAGMPWEVQVDFRALAGETGAFNIRSARLLTLTETDEAGPEHPCQLTRGGLVFIPEPGAHTYFLYIDPHPGPDTGFRETRATQSRSGARLENRRMLLRLSPVDGFLSGWRLQESGLELLPHSQEPDEEEPETGAWRLRVQETGPLLARVRAEGPDGSLRQFDLAAGQSWAEFSSNAPLGELSLPSRPDLWSSDARALMGSADGVRPLSLEEAAGGVAGVRWAALHRSDGLTLAMLPAGDMHATVTTEGLRFTGAVRGGSVLLFAAWEADPAAALEALLAARSQPPSVRLGVVEERRVREF